MGERILIKTTIQELRGADLVIRARPGLTKQWLARVVRCHIAYRELPGTVVSSLSADPLVVDRAEVSFGETETGFLVRIRGMDRSHGEEILARAQRLAGP
jgi:hypothetical protein